ncbi:MAG: carbamoyltransferase HypF [Saprospiraceae bacterium]|jgi:hydrogenase maturation protein HypF|nr:carbamoyltransferase HypF [Saprospiraceae bacterium]
MANFHIHIKGQVQGVGFRPFIFNLAKKMGITGTVSNGTDGVHIHINVAGEDKCDQFIHQIFVHAPPKSKIVSIDITDMDHQSFPDFSILHSEPSDHKNVHLSPDFGICDDCRSELLHDKNRRYQYPFITCTQCGPRLSVVNDIPYDRALTTMSGFIMCPECQEEYDSPDDIRYFSQTNSCATCGIKLKISSDPDIPESDIIAHIVHKLKDGQIVAVKGIGGYLLLCDASNSTAIQTLRDRKHRPKKPFALMYPDLKSIHQDVILTHDATYEIDNTAFPIILCYKKPELHSNIQCDMVATGLSQLGVMLPNSPLLCLISVGFGGPLIATSANVSGSPIIYEDALVQDQLAGIADIILSHNRDIVMPQDDSVIRYTPFYGRKIVIRRSRGYAPTYWPSKEMNITPMICTGADMKSAFLLAEGQNIYLSQFLGDLSAYDSQITYDHVLQHYLKITGIVPQIIIRDKHPQYFLPKAVGENPDTIIYSVQHHKAHFCACLFENNLMDSKDSVLGIIWDGVGYGDDGQIWGGEFFIFENKEITRLQHISYFDYLLGDKMSLQPRLAALSLCKNVAGANTVLKHKFSDFEWTLYKKMLDNGSVVMTSSMGRIFDAVASLLGISDINSYEGESAMMLEESAYRYYLEKGLDWDESYHLPEEVDITISMEQIITRIIIDINKSISLAQISAKFHLTLVKLIDKVARIHGVKRLAFSGGVFQNGLLVDLIHHHLRHDYTLYFHRNVSPNDENIALGQMAMSYITKTKLTTT